MKPKSQLRMNRLEVDVMWQNLTEDIVKFPGHAAVTQFIDSGRRSLVVEVSV